MMTRPAIQALFLGAALLTLGACESKVDAPPPVVEAPLPVPPMGTLASQTYAAVDTMLNSAPSDLPAGTVVLVASLASIDNLEEFIALRPRDRRTGRLAPGAARPGRARG